MLSETSCNSRNKLPGSFRDSDGFMFMSANQLFRQINSSYKTHYDTLMSCGLYNRLVEEGHLIAHQEVSETALNPGIAYKVIKPEPIPFISYPYEWCFQELKQAALLTLEIQKIAIEHKMTLKDASAFNIQFVGHRPVFIDTLSFECLDEHEPWFGYRQFCQQFLAPLLLSSYTDSRALKLLSTLLDGIPLDLASSLLPWHSWFNPGIFFHLHLHGKMQSKECLVQSDKVHQVKTSVANQQAVIDNLRSLVQELRLPKKQTTWANYYDKTNYTDAGLDHKRLIVEQFIEQVAPRMVWDFGANTGRFSRLSVDRGITTISIDGDPNCVEAMFQQGQKQGLHNWLPLYIDLTNPSPSLGWNHSERMSLIERGPADMVMALALMHHLLITHNVDMDKLVEFFAAIANWLTIEFVPIEDPQCQILLNNVGGTHHSYTRQSFENEFQRYFDITQCQTIDGSERTIYLMKRRQL